jgi:hypothetical protein
MTLARFTPIGVAVFLLLLLWAMRFEVGSLAVASRAGVYVLDRWTGSIQICSPDQCTKIEH